MTIVYLVLIVVIPAFCGLLICCLIRRRPSVVPSHVVASSASEEGPRVSFSDEEDDKFRLLYTPPPSYDPPSYEPPSYDAATASPHDASHVSQVTIVYFSIGYMHVYNHMCA